MKQSHVLYLSWSYTQLGFLIPRDVSARPGGYVYILKVFCIGIHTSSVLDLSKFLSPPFTQAKLYKTRILFKATLINSVNSDHLAEWYKTNALFLFPKLVMNFTCAINRLGALAKIRQKHPVRERLPAYFDM